MKTFTYLLFASLLVGSFSVRAQYCMLPGRKIYSANQPGITNFKLNTINRTSGHVEKPLDSPSLVVTTDSTTLARGKTYTVTISHSKDAVFFPTAKNNIRIWIDYNKNFQFTDAGETVLSKDDEAPGTTYTGTFTVPANAPLGTTRMRVTAKMGPDAGHTAPTSCDTLPKDPLDYHGEMEDYKVTIVQFPASVEELADNVLEVSLYPNPVSRQATISLNEKKNEPLSIDLHDVAGRHIANLVQEKIQRADTYEVDIANHVTAAGVYFIRVSSGNASAYKKVIKTE
jgi:hypothetical protein